MHGASRVTYLTIAFAFVAMSLGAQPSAVDPLAGRWELNVTRSHYGGGAEVRKKESFVCTAITAGISCTIKSVRASGKIVVGGFTGTYDGTPGLTHGISDVDHVRLTRVNESIADATFSAQGSPVFGYRTVRSANGQSLTIISVDPVSRAVLNSVVVYDRRSPR